VTEPLAVAGEAEGEQWLDNYQGNGH